MRTVTKYCKNRKHASAELDKEVAVGFVVSSLSWLCHQSGTSLCFAKSHLSVPPLDLPVAFGAKTPQALKTLGSILGNSPGSDRMHVVSQVFCMDSITIQATEAHKSFYPMATV